MTRTTKILKLTLFCALLVGLTIANVEASQAPRNSIENEGEYCDPGEAGCWEIPGDSPSIGGGGCGIPTPDYCYESISYHLGYIF